MELSNGVGAVLGLTVNDGSLSCQATKDLFPSLSSSNVVNDRGSFRRGKSFDTSHYPSTTAGFGTRVFACTLLCLSLQNL